MKYTIFVFVLTVSQAFAIGSYSQNTRLSLSLSNTMIRNVLQEIENESDYYFMYDATKVDVNRGVSISCESMLIADILDQLFHGTSIRYKINNRQIALYHAPSGSVTRQSLQRVSGKITDAQGAPLPGVTVVVKGTGKGTITDIDGNYNLTDVKEGDILSFSFIGMRSVEVVLKGEPVINLTMVEEVTGIEEVVAIGYGIIKKQNLTGSVSSVQFNDVMESRPVTNIASALTGLSSGLVVTQSSSAPGNESISMRIRGVSSWTNSEPLVLIDGVSGSIKDVNPNDVESVSVLKDASSSAIYGSRASNGVILITTKRGNKDKVKVNYNGYVGQQSVTNMIDFISDYPTHMELLNESAINSGQPAYYRQDLIDEWRERSKTDPLNYPNTDWFREILQSSMATEHNLSVTGGNEKSNIMMSLGYLDNKGVIDHAGLKKYSIRLNADSKVTDWLTVGGNVFGYWSDRGPVNMSQLFSNMLGTNPGILPKAADGRYGGSTMEGENSKAYNPRAFVDNSIGNYEGQHVGVKFFAKVNFLKYFEFETNFAANYDNSRTWLYYKPVSIWDFNTNTELYETYSQNSLSNASSRNYLTLVNTVLRFHRSNGTHNIAALLGFDQEYSRSDVFTASKTDFVSDVIYVLDAGTANPTATGTAADRALRSFFGRVNYDYKGKYLFEANARYDGSSRFMEGRRWGFFPSFSAGWRVSEESFFEPLKQVANNVKIRASWGQLGNNMISDYGYQSLYNTAQTYSFGGTPVAGTGVVEIANSKLTWEVATMTNVGLDLSFLNNALSISADIFNKITDNQLLQLPIPYIMGNVTPPYQNTGKVKNKGFEIQAVYSGKAGNGFAYSIGGNLSFVKNKVLKYKGEVIDPMNSVQIITEGEAIGRYYVREVDHIVQDPSETEALLAEGYSFYPATPQPGDFLYRNAKDDETIGNDDDRVIKGSSIPKMTYGINLNASYKGFDLYVLGQGVSGIDAYYGGDAFNTFDLHWDYLIRKSVLNRWTPQNKSTKYPRLTNKLPNNTSTSDYWLQSAAYFRIKSMQFGYTVPRHITSKVYVDRFRLYTGLENFFTFSNYDGFDPENVGVTYPTMKQWVVGLNVTF
ncbi:MAG: TonB-dependent receptor [Mangrovibacterium sp.]